MTKETAFASSVYVPTHKLSICLSFVSLGFENIKASRCVSEADVHSMWIDYKQEYAGIVCGLVLLNMKVRVYLLCLIPPANFSKDRLWEHLKKEKLCNLAEKSDLSILKQPLCLNTILLHNPTIMLLFHTVQALFPIHRLLSGRPPRWMNYEFHFSNPIFKKLNCYFMMLTDRQTFSSVWQRCVWAQ